MELKRNPAVKAAKQFIQKYFPECEGALLAGSVVRGERTPKSDLDMIVFIKDLKSAYRESLIDFNWPIEVFVHSLTSYQHFIEKDCKEAKPSMARMISEGIIIADNGKMKTIKREARERLEQGPEPWTDEIIALKRYFITDALDDFLGSTNRGEELMIAGALAQQIHEFVLRTNGFWIGSSKWIIRSLRQYNSSFADEFVDAFDEFYQTGKKEPVSRLADKVLSPYGGRLFEGFSLGKETCKSEKTEEQETVPARL
ncbi:nucleotidyltransferase domain-containing protein [Heyndrickxia acidicola]|uniref:Nucleotidyltransferase domain-containing protein n=1 Tax=Heyndrickxia acidicola TaxID=209389 RepID=A0ABU6MLH4_9BACI|nr:nucleotidyltransferase domain-containing protein [Heyndrickxia acidicola]MED1205540.1 nucleotidyltransferase domain-containing protein [Heyndrickxia acidicola]